MAQTVDDTLAERGKRYGDFREHARISQNIQAAMTDSPNWSSLDPVKREGLIIIAHKIARALNGDPEYRDNWHDIAGYAKLVEDRCVETAPQPPIRFCPVLNGPCDRKPRCTIDHCTRPKPPQMGL